MRDLESEYRVIEMLYAIKIFIEAANQLTAKDIKSLKQMASLMNESGKFKSQEPREMTISDIETALGYPVKIIKEETM